MSEDKDLPSSECGPGPESRRYYVADRPPDLPFDPPSRYQQSSFETKQERPSAKDKGLRSLESKRDAAYAAQQALLRLTEGRTPTPEEAQLLVTTSNVLQLTNDAIDSYKGR